MLDKSRSLYDIRSLDILMQTEIPDGDFTITMITVTVQ